MSGYRLMPRLATDAAVQRLGEIVTALRNDVPAHQLVVVTPGEHFANTSGGTPADDRDLRRWRREVSQTMEGIAPGTARENAIHSMRLGQALAEIINPSPSDAAHDETWSFLSLMVFPDILLQRWSGISSSGDLPADRWIGRPVGRDRNYLKLAWRRWITLGPVMQSTGDPLGEDEFGALLERSAVARNPRLLRAAARCVIEYDGIFGRTAFARVLMRELTALTGPLQLDILSDRELKDLVSDTAERLA